LEANLADKDELSIS